MRAFAVVIGLAGILALTGQSLVTTVIALAGSAPTTTPTTWTLDRLVLGIAEVAALGAICVLCLSGIVTALGAAAGIASGRLARLGPSSLRRVVLAACGGALLIPVASGAATAVEPDASGTGDFPALTGLPLPDLPITPAGLGEQSALTVRVRDGDSLWSIAAEQCGPDAAAADIAALVAELHARNLRQIGSDPDLIFPGTELTLGGIR